MASRRKIKDERGSASAEPKSQENSSSGGVAEIGKQKIETGTSQLDYKSILENATALALKAANENTDRKVAVLEKETGSRIEKIEDSLSKVADKQISIIETLAIFVSLFTFVSVDIQIFKSGVSFLSATGTSLITLGALIFFIFLLHFVLNTENFFKKSKSLFIIGLISFFSLILGGIYLIKVDYNDYTEHIRENFYTKQDVDKSINQNTANLERFKQCLKNGGWKICF